MSQLDYYIILSHIRQEFFKIFFTLGKVLRLLGRTKLNAPVKCVTLFSCSRRFDFKPT